MPQNVLFDDLDTLTAPFGAALDAHLGDVPRSRPGLLAGVSFGRGTPLLDDLLAGVGTGQRPDLLAGTTTGGRADLFAGTTLGGSADLFGGVRFGGVSSSGGGGNILGNLFSGLGTAARNLWEGVSPFNTNKPVPAPALNPAGPAAVGGYTPGVARWAAQAQQTFTGLIDPDVMLAIMTNESGGDPGAYNKAGNAYGLFQQVGFGDGDPNWSANTAGQFAAARTLAEQKLAGINQAYAANGLNPDERTRARDFALAWAGHFDYQSGLPNPSSRDIGSGQTAQQLADIFLANYDRIKAGRQQAGPGGAGGDWGGGLIGTPYVLGGLRGHPDSPQQGLDCSEFTAYVWGQKGVTLPWNAQQQYNQTARVEASQLQVGDLVFFSGTNPDDPDPITHVGIYVGNGRMINAQDDGVQYADLSSPYWQGHLAGYGRVTPPTGGGGASYR